MSIIITLLLIFALVFVLMAAFNTPSTRVQWGWLGLACALLALVVSNRGLLVG